MNMKEELEKKAVGAEGRSVVVPFLVGGLVGAGIALLLAPKSGREIRTDIKDLAQKTRDNVASTIQKGKDLYQEGTSVISGAIEAGKAAYVEEKERHLKSA
jgi:gas vesicle protein